MKKKKKLSIGSVIIELSFHVGVYMFITYLENYQKQRKQRKYKRFLNIIQNINNKNGIPPEIVEYIISYACPTEIDYLKFIINDNWIFDQLLENNCIVLSTNKKNIKAINLSLIFKKKKPISTIPVWEIEYIQTFIEFDIKELLYFKNLKYVNLSNTNVKGDINTLNILPFYHNRWIS